MRIAIEGAHGVGKSTLINELKKDDRLNDFFFLDEIARYIGIEKISTEKRYHVQPEMMKTQKQIEDYHENIICDRSILSCGVYDTSVLPYVIEIAKGRYDLILYVPVQFGLRDDGFRNIDVKFQKEIDARLRNLLKNFPNVQKITSKGQKARKTEAMYHILNTIITTESKKVKYI